MKEDEEFKIGDYVMKAKGYDYPGVIVGKYTTLSGELRYVVELVFTPLQHIFAPSQLRLAERFESKDIAIRLMSEDRGEIW